VWDLFHCIPFVVGIDMDNKYDRSMDFNHSDYALLFQDFAKLSIFSKLGGYFFEIK
jgi:hypothetical protein